MLKVYLLGRLSVVLGDQVVVGFRSVKTQALLGYLAMQREPVRRTTLIELLWPDYDHRAGLASLRSSLVNLHALLGNHIVISRTDIKLIDYWCDAAVVGTRTTKLALMPGCEGIDSPMFQAWLRQLHSPPPIGAREWGNGGDTHLASVQDALVILSNLGWSTEATKALNDLGAWMLGEGHLEEAEQFTHYSRFMTKTKRRRQ